MDSSSRTGLTLLVNPRSGGGRAGRMAHQFSRLLSAAGDVTVQFSTSMADAVTRAHAIVASSRPGDGLVVVGGDGMASVGLNACAGTDVVLGIIPAGTGNDFCRGMGIPLSPTDACRVITEGHAGVVDLASVATAAGQQRYVGSVISTGFDAKVNRATNQRPQLGALSYAVAALQELRTFRPLRYRLDIDGEPRDLDAILVAVGNSGFFGGGVRILPDYSVTDGLLDVTIVHPVRVGMLLRLLPTLWTGGRIDHPALERFRATRVVIDGDGLFSMADGEELGDVPLAVTAVPSILTLYLPASVDA